jgi:predicted transcriptional regulator
MIVWTETSSVLSPLKIGQGTTRERRTLAISHAKCSVSPPEYTTMAVENNLTELTAVIVACFVSNSPLTATEVPELIASIHAALRRIDVPMTRLDDGKKPAVPIEESIAHDYLICLNDGQKLRALKRYIHRKYSLTPEQYREKWGLPDDYPMVAPAYSELRSRIAKEAANVGADRPRTKKQRDG